MTQEELLKQIDEVMGKKEGEKIPVLSYLIYNRAPLLALINLHTKEVIGEDDNTPREKLTDVGIFIQSDMNQLRAEMRERAGLSEKGSK